MRGKLVHELELLVCVTVRVWGWVRVMVEFGTSSAFKGWVRVRVLGYGFGVRGRKVKSRDCALASDLVKAALLSQLRCGHCKELAAHKNRNDDSKNEKFRNAPNVNWG